MRRDPRDWLPSAMIAALCLFGIAFVVLLAALHKAVGLCTS